MKSFILKIFILAGIATLILGQCHHNTIRENEFFFDLFAAKDTKLLTEKSPFLASIENKNPHNPKNPIESTPGSGRLDPTGDFPMETSKCYFKSTNASISGTSNLDSWKSEITRITFIGSIQSGNQEPDILRDVAIRIPVEGIISEDGSIITKKTQEAFKSNQYPDITYQFEKAKIEVDKRDSVTIVTSGDLSMAGVSKPIDLVAKGVKLANGEYRLRITKKLKMTDFNIPPPTILLGTLRAGNEITLDFDLKLGASR
jgi:hypothetical protein